MACYNCQSIHCRTCCSEAGTLTIEDRRALCAAEVTIDGRRAIITGAANDFATVATIPDGSTRVEYAWPTVARIVAAGGAFRI